MGFDSSLSSLSSCSPVSLFSWCALDLSWPRTVLCLLHQSAPTETSPVTWEWGQMGAGWETTACQLDLCLLPPPVLMVIFSVTWVLALMGAGWETTACLLDQSVLLHLLVPVLRRGSSCAPWALMTMVATWETSASSVTRNLASVQNIRSSCHFTTLLISILSYKYTECRQ